MNLYSTPRPLHPHLLRPGDQLATQRVGGHLIQSETSFIDAELQGRVLWTAVHAIGETPIDESPNDKMRHYRVWHTYGEHDVRTQALLMVRECLTVEAHLCLAQPG